MIYFFIGIGAFFGAISRYLLSSYLEKFLLLGFPLGTVIVNLIGCYLIGVFLAFNFSNKDLIGPIVAIGYLSSFTTFSAFTKEVFLFSNSMFSREDFFSDRKFESDEEFKNALTL